VRELEIVAGGDDALRVHVWLGDAVQSRLVALVTAIVRRATDGRLWGVYRYRVMSQGADDRVSLQSLDAATGAPDLSMITPWPGVGGARTRPTVGSFALVQFIAGDRTRPVVTSFGPYGSESATPTTLVLGGGPLDTTPAAARVGDSVDVRLPVGTANGSTIVWSAPTPADPVVGTAEISSGSSKVRIA
jgi:hypothetical protein